MNNRELVTVVLAAISFLMGGIFILLNFLFIDSDAKNLQIENCIESLATKNLSRIGQIKWIEIIAAIMGASGQTLVLILHMVISACLSKEQVTDKFYKWMICIHFWLILSSGILFGLSLKLVIFSSDLLTCATQSEKIEQFLNINLILMILACEEVVSAFVRAIFLIGHHRSLSLKSKTNDQFSHKICSEQVPQINLKIVDSSNQALEGKSSSNKEYIISEKPSLNSSQNKDQSTQQKKRKIFGRILHPFQKDSLPFQPQKVNDATVLNQVQHESVVEKYEISPEHSQGNEQSHSQVVISKNSRRSNSRNRIFETINFEEKIKLKKTSERIYE